MKLLDIHPSNVDPEMRRQSRLLAVCLAVLTPSFLCIDIVLSVATDNHRPPLPGYVFLIGTFLLNRAGYYRVAAALVIAMSSIVGLGQVFLGTSSMPLATLHYVSLGPMLGAIFLSMRSVFVLTALNVAGVHALRVVLPSLGGGGADHVDGDQGCTVAWRRARADRRGRRRRARDRRDDLERSRLRGSAPRRCARRARSGPGVVRWLRPRLRGGATQPAALAWARYG